MTQVSLNLLSSQVVLTFHTLLLPQNGSSHFYFTSIPTKSLRRPLSVTTFTNSTGPPCLKESKRPRRNKESLMTHLSQEGTTRQCCSPVSKDFTEKHHSGLFNTGGNRDSHVTHLAACLTCLSVVLDELDLQDTVLLYMMIYGHLLVIVITAQEAFWNFGFCASKW